jgi:dipeptide/tripeptide permease
MLRLIPIFIATFIPSAMVHQLNTLYVKQGLMLNRSIGNFTIPPTSLAAFTMLVYYIVYEHVVVKLIRRSRGITLLQRMGTGVAIHVIIMLIASFIEKHRLAVVDNGGSASILILVPQYVLMGLTVVILEAAKMKFFYDQTPQNMKSLGSTYSLSTTAVGSFLSTFFMSTISHVTSRTHGQRGWVQDNINASHIDYYYAFLAVLNI